MGRFRPFLLLQVCFAAAWLTQFAVVSNDRFSTTSEVPTTTQTTTTTTAAVTTTSTTTTTFTTTTTTTRQCFDVEGFISPDDRGPEGCDGLSPAACETYGDNGQTQYFQKPSEYCCVCGGGYTTTTSTTTTTTTTLSCAAVLNNQNIGYVGDGYCDSGETNHNTRSCNWDGGDCCESTCTSGRTYGCGVNGYDCQAPADEQITTTYVGMIGFISMVERDLLLSREKLFCVYQWLMCGVDGL